ncbi:MAG: transferase [Gammaproteobacteria bacterium]|nr:transferase [Gammaproteobacteria bacterium]
MKPNLIIYGIGSMAQTYASYLQDFYNIVAFTVESSIKNSDHYNDLPLIEFEKLTDKFPPERHKLIVAVGYIEMNQIRTRIAWQAKQQGYQLISYFDPSVKKHNKVSLGENSVIFEHSSIHCNSKIGHNVFISSGVHIGHDCEIGDNVWINSGVCLAGGVKISNNTFIGMNATVSHNVTIAENNFIGAATLVNNNTQIDSVIVAPAGELLPMNSQTFLRFSKVMNNV